MKSATISLGTAALRAASRALRGMLGEQGELGLDEGGQGMG